MKKFLHLPVLILTFLFFGTSNTGFSEWMTNFQQRSARYFLARATERVHDKKDKRFSNFAGSLEDRDRLGAESADEQHIQWVRDALKAMGEERYAEVPVYKLKDDQKFSDHKGCTTEHGIWLKHNSSESTNLEDDLFTAYHESAHWRAFDGDRKWHARESIFNLSNVALLGSFVALQAAQLYFKKPFAVNSILRGVGSLAMNGVGGVITATLLTLHFLLPVKTSVEQETERCADIQAAKTLCSVGKSAVVQKVVDSNLVTLRSGVANQFKLDPLIDKERIECIIQDELVVAPRVATLLKPTIWEETNNLMRILAEHRASSYAL